MSRNARLFFVASVGLNLLLAGMLIGNCSHRFMMTPNDEQAALAKLPEDRRALFISVLQPAKKEIDADHAKMDAAKKEALRLLTAEPFDEAAYRVQLDKLGVIHSQMKKKLAEAIIKLAKQLTPDERAALSDIITHPPYGMPPGPPPGGHPH